MRILLVSTADWDHPFWTNKQHVTMALAEQGHEVLYVESLGIRSFSRESVQDSKRVVRRLRRFLGRPRLVAPRVHVASPLVVPIWSRRSIVTLNRVLMWLQMVIWRLTWGPWDTVWTYSPITMAAVPVGSLPVLYHCVDNISAQPLMPTEAIDRYETELVHRADVIFSTAPDLTDRLGRMGAVKVIEHTNVVDFDHFQNAVRRPSTEIKTIGFVGALSRYKVDLKLLKLVAENFPDHEIVLVGQVGEGQPGETLEELRHLNNVKLLGPKPYGELPQIMAGFDVALLPVPINDYTKSMFPMKFFEYLSSGVPVVSTAIPSLEKYGSHAFISVTNEQFLEDIRAAMDISDDWRDNGRTLASNYTYRRRTADMYAALKQVTDIRSDRRNGSLKR